jgi:phage recombination protein Bet
MTSNELALPESVNPSTWNADTAAMMEFAGLTWFEGTGENRVRVFAPSGIMAGFIAACERTGLDPTSKQIYAAQMGGKWTVLLGVDGFRVVAQRTGEYDGQDPIEFQYTEDGPWSTTPGKGNPYAARIRIYRKGVSRPLEQTVTFAEFGGRGQNWEKRPAHMLGIRAETHAFRRMFPMQMSGLYTPEDFQDEGTDTGDAIVVVPSENWNGLIDAAQTKEEVKAVVDQAKAVNEFDDRVRTHALTRYGMLNREVEVAEERPTAHHDDPAYPTEPEFELAVPEVTR